MSRTQESANICEKHNAPLNFWSNKEQKYQCIKCLINEEEVHYVDESYKKALEEFRDIQSYARTALKENAPLPHMIHDWKDDIRDMLQTVQDDFINMIKEYTRKFYNSLIRIEHSSKMEPFYNEDIRQNQRLEAMKEKQEQITAIIERIDATVPNLKAQVVREEDERMRKLEQDLIAKDKEMKKMNARVSRAMTETVDLTTLSHKVFGKYIKFINTQVEERQNSHPLIAKSRKLKQLEQDGVSRTTGGTDEPNQKGQRDQSPTP